MWCRPSDAYPYPYPFTHRNAYTAANRNLCSAPDLHLNAHAEANSDIHAGANLDPSTAAYANVHSDANPNASPIDLHAHARTRAGCHSPAASCTGDRGQEHLCRAPRGPGGGRSGRCSRCRVDYQTPQVSGMLPLTLTAP